MLDNAQWFCAPAVLAGGPITLSTRFVDHAKPKFVSRFQSLGQSLGRVAIHTPIREFPHAAQQALGWALRQQNSLPFDDDSRRMDIMGHFLFRLHNRSLILPSVL